MRTISGTLRPDLALYRDAAAFAQFGSDLDKATQAQLARGKRLVEILKQGQYQPMRVGLQVVSIYAGTRGHLDNLAIEAIRPFETALHRAMLDNKLDLIERLEKATKFDEALDTELKSAIVEFKDQYVKENQNALAA